jgi:hypothetical protein
MLNFDFGMYSPLRLVDIAASIASAFTCANSAPSRPSGATQP